MESLISLLDALNSMSPLAVIALLGIVIYLLVKGKTAVDEKVDQVSGNHLSGLPEMVETLKRIEFTLKDMNDNIVYIRARVNGK